LKQKNPDILSELNSVELTGVEPVSKSSPTARLQFSPLLSKTAGMTEDQPPAESACEIVGITLQTSGSPYTFHYTVNR